MIKHAYGWNYSPRYRETYSGLSEHYWSPASSIAISTYGIWNAVWAVFPEVDMFLKNKMQIGSEMGNLIGYLYYDLNHGVDNLFLQLHTEKPTLEIAEKLIGLANRAGVKINHNIYQRLGLNNATCNHGSGNVISGNF
jgi:hypothetical protein